MGQFLATFSWYDLLLHSKKIHALKSLEDNLHFIDSAQVNKKPALLGLGIHTVKCAAFNVKFYVQCCIQGEKKRKTGLLFGGGHNGFGVHKLGWGWHAGEWASGFCAHSCCKVPMKLWNLKFAPQGQRMDCKYHKVQCQWGWQVRCPGNLEHKFWDFGTFTKSS